MDYQLNRRKKNDFVFINQCIGVDLALKVFLSENKWGKGKMFQVTEIYFFILNESNGFLLKYNQLSISQSRSSSQTTYISK